MKRLLCGLMAVLFLCSLTGCHRHTPGPEPTCTEPQLCTECGEVLQEALGHNPDTPTCAHDLTCMRCGEVLASALPHTPGSAPSCTQDQICTFCSQILTAANGHTVDEVTGLCTVCGDQICQPGQSYTRPGKNSWVSDDTAGLVAETESAGHYHNDIPSYYNAAVLICGDYGVEYFSPSTSGSDGWAGIVNDFAARYPQVNTTALLVPKCCAYEAPSDQRDVHDDIAQFISATYDMLSPSVKRADAMGVMDQHAGEYMFYRTDHHWTSLGAYYASAAYCDANGMDVLPLDSYETTLRTGVTGTLYMYGNHDGNLQRNPDYTVCHYPQTGYVMRCYNGGWYNAVAVNGAYRDYASVFINGDNPLTVIRTDNHNGKTLMIFKESYGNAFVPYMIDYYEQVIVVDIRSSGYLPVTSELVSTYGVTDALFINNAQAAVSLQGDLRTTALS